MGRNDQKLVKDYGRTNPQRVVEMLKVYAFSTPNSVRVPDVGARIHCVFTELTETSFMSCAFDLWDRAHAIQTQRCSPSPNTVADVQS